MGDKTGLRSGELTLLAEFEIASEKAGLTNYGDDDFALFLRKAFIKGAGYTDDALDRRIVGIVDTGVRCATIVCVCVCVSDHC